MFFFSKLPEMFHFVLVFSFFGKRICRSPPKQNFSNSYLNRPDSETQLNRVCEKTSKHIGHRKGRSMGRYHIHIGICELSL